MLEETLLNTFNSQYDPKETALIARVCNGDQHALELLYNDYHPRLFRFIGRVTWNPEIIEEVINDVMYTVWEKAVTYNHQCRLSTWIFGIAYNKARQALRDSDRSHEDSLDDMNTDSLEFGTNDVGLKQLEMRDLLEDSFKMLSADQRTVVELTYFEGLHYSEIALLMDCPENTVKTRMHHARKILASHLTNYEDASK